jgi:3-deoxy-D-manno-octulosonic-acid transferase
MRDIGRPRSQTTAHWQLAAGLVLYNLLELALSPFLVARFVRHVFWMKRDHAGWLQRLGLRRALSPEQARFFRAGSPRVWLFCRSIGEYRAALPFVRRLVAVSPTASVLIFSITDEVPRAVADSPPGDRVYAAYLPYDFLLPALLHLAAAAPDLLLFVESFWYPNLLPLARLRGCPAVLLNFTVKPITFRHTRLVTFRHWLHRAIDLYCVQTETDQGVLTKLGVAPERCSVTGNAKFDVGHLPRAPLGTHALRRELGAGDAVLVAGSTHGGEEEPVLAAFARVRASEPSAQLILAPRYLRRLEAIEAGVADMGLRCARRSRAPHAASSWDVLILDTIGELAEVYAIGVAAFVGGSFAPVGGHNLVEPIAAGVLTLFGPHIAAFRAIAADATAAGVARRVEGPDELAGAWLQALHDEGYRREVRERAEALMRAGSGATERWMEAIEGVLRSSYPVVRAPQYAERGDR